MQSTLKGRAKTVDNLLKQSTRGWMSNKGALGLRRVEKDVSHTLDKAQEAWMGTTYTKITEFSSVILLWCYN